MRTNSLFPGAGTRNRILLIIAVIALSLWTIYPIGETLKLGLDLNGGVQLVLRVLQQPDASNDRRDEIVEQALRTISRRVNELGVAEPVVARYTAADQILVQLPGVSEVERARQIIKSTAQLRLTLVDKGPFSSREAALAAYHGGVPPHLAILPGAIDPTLPDAVAFYVVHTTPAVAGNDLRQARQTLDEYNRPAVGFTLAPDAARRFGELTEQNIGRPLATVLDGRVMSIAIIHTRIDADGRITGVSHDEMVEQVINLNAGALPADLEYVEERTVGASLGHASIRAGVLASAGGLTFVLLFMLAYYRRAGVNALVSIAVNLLILLAFVAYVPVTLTLPGIAGLILTIGMGVDSNVLIFERIKEELAAGRSSRGAVAAGFARVWLTIIDTHATSLIAAAFLFQFGTDAIRGFATTLTIGLLANVFTAVFVSRTLFEVALSRHRPGQALSIGQVAPANTTVNITRWRWHAIAASGLIVLAGAAAVATRGLPLGIDFSGGTMVVVQFHEAGVGDEQVRQAVAAVPGDEVVQRYGSAADRRFLIRLPLPASDRDGLEAAREVTQALRDAGLPDFAVVQREIVSATIGADLQRRGIYATAGSILAIAVYIGTRFRFAFAVGAVAATLHDVLIAVAALSLAGYDLTLNVTAALLAIVGYSVNDTIVIFDRVRENLARAKGDSLEAVINLSVNQTLSRTVITAGTTLLSALALYVFGGDTLRGFAFTMVVGIVAGTYSTVFIASALAMAFSRCSGTRQRSDVPSASRVTSGER